MKYRRALIVTDPRVDPLPAISALRAIAPGLERVVVVARLRGLETWWSSEAGRGRNAHDLSALEAWRRRSAAIAKSAEVRQTPDLPVHALVDLALAEDADLLVAGALSFETAPLLASVGRRLGIAVLWPAGAVRASPVKHVFCATMGERTRASIAAFLREHGDPSLEISLVGPAAMPRSEVSAELQVLGIPARVNVVPRAVRSLRAALDAAAHAGPVDLVVVARVPALLLLGYTWPAPVLLVPSTVSSATRARAFDMTDVVDLRGTARARVDEVTAVGTLAPAADLVLALVCDGRVLATVITSPSGDVELPAGLTATWLGAVRVVDDAPVDSLAAVEQRFAVVRPSERALLLFDAELPERELGALRDAARASSLEPLAVRLRPTSRTSVLRARLRRATLSERVVDARAILDEGDALDVAEENDPVRLRRAGARLRAAGFHVAAVFHRGLERPEPLLDAPAAPIDGNDVEVELDNARARSWLLDAIGSSRRSVNVQVYMALDDDVGRAVEGALTKAAGRGVTTRVLVDSLHGMHGSFGTENRLLSRLSACPGIELRVSRPLTGLPSVTDLKQRDHRKIVIVDDRVALVGGRNLSHEYYTGFGEVHLDAGTTWRRVPWLDAGVRVEGPAVAAIGASFLEAWTEAGGASFPVDAPAPAGSTPVRVVVHRGLRDARTLEAYLDLVEHARSHVYAVNGFPYVLELQHALVSAVRRGVRVRALTGHLTPMHGATLFAGAWSSARATATEFVHSRLDPIVDAGGEVYLFARHPMPGWQANLGVVYPHVHAKLMSVDGRRCAVGSANFDVTSSYWESELMLVVEDAVVVGRLESTLDELIAVSKRVDRDDPTWRESARRRNWMRHWPGVLAL